MSEPRTIKKYPNRRLYDTVESRYITLADIRRLVLERIDFVVERGGSGKHSARSAHPDCDEGARDTPRRFAAGIDRASWRHWNWRARRVRCRWL